MSAEQNGGSRTFALAVEPSLGSATLRSLVGILRELNVLRLRVSIGSSLYGWKTHSCLLRSVVEVHLREASDTLLAYLLEFCDTLS